MHSPSYSCACQVLFECSPLAQQQQQQREEEEQEQLMQLPVASWLKALQGAAKPTTGLKGQSATFLLLTTVCACLSACVCACVCVCNYSISHRLNACMYVRMLKLLPYAPPFPSGPLP